MGQLFPNQKLGAWLELSHSGRATGMLLPVRVGHTLKTGICCMVMVKLNNFLNSVSEGIHILLELLSNKPKVPYM
jgi:hypothetical protein